MQTAKDEQEEFRGTGQGAATTAAAIDQFIATTPSVSKLDTGATALAMLLLARARHVLIEASNAIGDMLTPDELPAAPATRPAKRGRAAASGVLRRCLCTHPYSDHSDAGGCLECGCEAFDDEGLATPAGVKGTHRHVFGPEGKCTKCGKEKSANGRKPAASSGAVTGEAFIDTRALPLAARLVGDAAADRFADGGQGSSGVRR